MTFQSQLQLQLSSNNCDSKNDTQHVYYIPTDAILAESQEHIYISIQSANFPNTFFNINENNNTLLYALSSNNIINTFTITPGNYNVKDLVNYFNTHMTNFNVTYDRIYNKLTFTNESGTNYKFFPTSKIYNILGFSKGLTYESTNGILKSCNGVNLDSIQYINIKMMNISTNNITKYNTNDRNIICSIPVDVPPYSVITYKNTNNFRVNTFRNTLPEIIIEFSDQNGNNINFNGVEWSMVLQLDIINFVV